VKWEVNITRMGETKISHRTVVEKTGLQRQLQRHMLVWDDNTKMGVKQIAFEDLDWIHVAQNTDHW
jgi:hypothetical protein